MYRGPHRSELEHNALGQVSNCVKSIPFCAVAPLARVGQSGACSRIIVAPCTGWNCCALGECTVAE